MTSGSATPVQRSSSMSAAIGVLDQVLSSLTNFGASGLALFLLDTSSFGVFVALQAVYGLGLAVFRSLVAEPLLHPFGVLDLDRAGALRASAVVGALLAVPLGAIALWSGSGLWLSLLFVVCLPLLMIQDAVRYIGFAEDEPVLSFKVDLVWFVVQFGLLVALVSTSAEAELATVAGPWLIGGALAGLFYLWRLRDTFGQAVAFRRYFEANWPKLRSLLRENLAGRLAPSIAVVLVGLVLTDRALGEAFTPRTVLGPVNIFFVSATSYGLAVAKRSFDKSDASFRSFIRLLSVALPSLAAIAALIVLVTPSSVIEWVIDTDVSEFRMRIAIVGLGMCFAGLNHARRVAVRIRGRVDLTSRVETISAAMLITFAVGGGVAFGATGVVTGIALAHCVASIIWSRAVGRASTSEVMS